MYKSYNYMFLEIGREFGSILFYNMNTFLQRIQTDPALNYYSQIIIDGIHEYDITGDFTLTILKNIIYIDILY